MSEEVILYGGPRHETTLVVPGSDTTHLDLDVSLNTDKVKGTRKGRYTRIHKVSGESTTQFEWIGYISPLVPLEA